MSKFIRTKEGIYEVEEIKKYSLDENQKLFINNKMRIAITENEVIKQADTIDELCDAFKNVSVYSGTISFSDYMNFELARFNKSDDATLYGYIYVILPNGAVRIEPVAKMDDKGDLELIKLMQ